MPTFTILNCGTMFDRSKRGEIIADFAANMQGQEGIDYIINEGPGGSTKNNLMPGTFDPFTRNKTPKKNSPAWSRTPMQTLVDVTQGKKKYKPGGHGILTALTKSTSKINAGITGHGWDDNIRYCIATLADLFPDGGATINLIGWSRGAVTCFRGVNWIREFLGDMWTVNICAIDPVAGIDAGEKLRDTFVVPGIVKNLVCLYAADEARGDFKAQTSSRLQILEPGKTSVSYLSFPGVHNTLVAQKNASLPEVTAMVRYLGHSFLTRHGTSFRTPEPNYSSTQLCELYARMQKKRTSYLGLMKKNFIAKQSGGFVERRTVRERSTHSFFVNDHHHLMFREGYPDIYNYFFTGQMPNSLGQDAASYKMTSTWGQRLLQFSRSAPDSFSVLADRFLLKFDAGVWKVSAPAYYVSPLV